MGQISADSVISLVLGLVIGASQLLFSVLTWWEAKRSAAQIVDPKKHALCGLLVLPSQDPSTIHPKIVGLADSGRVVTLNQLDINHTQSIQTNIVKQLVEDSKTEIRSPQTVHTAGAMSGQQINKVHLYDERSLSHVDSIRLLDFKCVRDEEAPQERDPDMVIAN